MPFPQGGWKRVALLFSGGVLATLALPPFFLAPFSVPAYSILFLMVLTAPDAKRAFRDGWLWGMGFFVSGLYWFCIALLTDPEKFAWLIPFTLLGLNAIIALYPAVACWIFKKAKCSGIAGVFVFSVIWAAVEYVRGHAFSGFPWNLAGYGFAASDASLQLASLVGVYTLTWFAVFISALPALFFDPAVTRKRAWQSLGIACAVLAAGYGWGAARLADADDANVPGVMLRLVQANINQNEKWDPAQRMPGVHKHVRLTKSPGLENITHVIWPETAVPFPLSDKDTLSRILTHALPPKTLLMTGALRIEGNEENWTLYNSVAVLDQSGAMVAGYDKNRLVPFGEFIPLRFLIPSWIQLPVGDKEFSRGPAGVLLDIPNQNTAMLPLICYEIIFPEMMLPSDAARRPGWILNLTNDAWFGMSTGPHQHFHMARMRAVEQGVPVVRSANTGISAVIDAWGRVKKSIPLGIEGVVDAGLPSTRLDTPYRRMGDWWLGVLIFIVLILITNQCKRSRN